jgi:hypothetical protein
METVRVIWKGQVPDEVPCAYRAGGLGVTRTGVIDEGTPQERALWVVTHLRSGMLLGGAGWLSWPRAARALRAVLAWLPLPYEEDGQAVMARALELGLNGDAVVRELFFDTAGLEPDYEAHKDDGWYWRPEAVEARPPGVLGAVESREGEERLVLSLEDVFVAAAQGSSVPPDKRELLREALGVMRRERGLPAERPGPGGTGARRAALEACR